jgi:hypothetical protein
MSDLNQQVQLLDPDTAYARVHHKVYAPVFFTKLAQDFGIKPQSEHDAHMMLTMASQLRAADDQGQTKVAQGQTSLLKAASNHLQSALASEGYAVADSNDELVEKAASEVALDPEIAHAVLCLQAQAAQRLAQQA